MDKIISLFAFLIAATSLEATGDALVGLGINQSQWMAPDQRLVKPLRVSKKMQSFAHRMRMRSEDRLGTMQLDQMALVSIVDDDESVR
jgi:hypothetical protein